MFNTDKEELLELIAHKLRFLERPVQWLGIDNLEPLMFITENYDNQFNLVNRAAANLVGIPREVELILIKLKGHGIPNMLAKIPQIVQMPGLLESSAKLQGKIHLIDDSLFSAASDLEQLEILAEVFYPKFFAFGYEGKAWLKLNV